jgi:uncharacterized Rmd1/YagE family protein
MQDAETLFSSDQVHHVEAWFIGERLDLRDLERGDSLAISPLTIRAGERGLAMLFRYGAVVLIDLSPLEQAAFLKTLAPFVTGPFANPESESVTIAAAADGSERFDTEGTLWLREISLDRLIVVAHILAKSVVLAHYETGVASIFDRIEDIAGRLQRGAGPTANGRGLLQQMGDVLSAQMQIVGRVEVTEKPELTWDFPDLDRLYERLSLEYELRERDRALTRKLEFISNTAQSYLDLLQTRQGLRVEWYIVILILVEIVLIVYDSFLAG